MIKVEVIGGSLTKAISAATKTAEDKVQRELERFALLTVRDAKAAVPVDEGLLKNRIAYEIKPREVTISAATNYAAYIEFGTRKFAASYVNSLPADWSAYAASFKGGGGSYEDFIVRLTAWIKRKGIASGNDLDNAAYLIAKKIMIEGIKPTPFLYPAYKKNKDELIKRLKK